MLSINKLPCSSSPHAPIIPQVIPKPAARPRIVLATLPPAMVFNADVFSGEARKWALTSLKMDFSSSDATYERRN